MPTYVEKDALVALEGWLNSSYESGAMPTISCRKPESVSLNAGNDSWLIESPTAADDVAKVLKPVIDIYDYRVCERDNPKKLLKGVADGKYWLRKNGRTQVWGPIDERAPRSSSSTPAPAPVAQTKLQELAQALEVANGKLLIAEDYAARLDSIRAARDSAQAAYDAELKAENERLAAIRVSKLLEAVNAAAAAAKVIADLRALIPPELLPAELRPQDETPPVAEPVAEPVAV